MGVAIVTGVSAAVLALLSWLLANGSKRSRLLSRIERQVAVLKDLPADHPAREPLDESLTWDAVHLRSLWLSDTPAPKPGGGGALEATTDASARRSYSSRVSTLLAAMSLLLAVAGTIYLLYTLVQVA